MLVMEMDRLLGGDGDVYAKRGVVLKEKRRNLGPPGASRRLTPKEEWALAPGTVEKEG